MADNFFSEFIEVAEKILTEKSALPFEFSAPVAEDIRGGQKTLSYLKQNFTMISSEAYPLCPYILFYIAPAL